MAVDPGGHRPRRDQPFYHLLAENDDTEYVAYVSEQNLLTDDSDQPVRHPQVKEYFEGYDAAAGNTIVCAISGSTSGG